MTAVVVVVLGLVFGIVLWFVVGAGVADATVTVVPVDPPKVLTVADPADHGFVKDADRLSLFLRQSDGLVGRVTVVRYE